MTQPKQQSGARCGAQGNPAPGGSATTSHESLAPVLAAPTQQLFFQDLGEADFFSGAETVSARTYAQVTGTTTEKRDAVVREALEMILQGMSQRRVSAMYSIGTTTLRVLMRKWEAEGKLNAIKERLITKMRALVESGVESLQEAVDEGRIKVEAIPIVMGITFDKLALLLGEPTAIIQSGTREPTIEDVRKLLESLPAAQVVETASKAAPKDYPVDYPEKPAVQSTDNKVVTHETN